MAIRDEEIIANEARRCTGVRGTKPNTAKDRVHVCLLLDCSLLNLSIKSVLGGVPVTFTVLRIDSWIYIAR